MITPTRERTTAARSAKKEMAFSDFLHPKAFDNSLQPNIIFTLPEGRIIRANRPACKLFGYSKRELLTLKKSDVFKVSDISFKKMISKRKEFGHVKAEILMIKKSGKELPCEVTSLIFKNEAGVRNSIMNIVDLSDRHNKQEKINAENKRIVADNIVIAQSKANFIQMDSDDWMKSVSQTTYDVIWDWDIAADEIYFGNNYSKIFGYKLNKSRVSFNEWMDEFRPNESAIIKKKFKKALASGQQAWQISYEFVRPDQPPRQVVCRARMLWNTPGKAIRAIGVMHDASKLQPLELEMKIKEKQLTEAVAEAIEMERSDLGKELHDNINQLLSAAVLYLDLARTDIKDVDIYVVHSLEYIRSAIEEIRKLSKSLTTDIIRDFGLAGAILKMSRDTMQSSTLQVHCSLDESFEHTLGEKFKLNAFRILQEQLNNIIKHAKASEVRIGFSKEADDVILSISDDGKGFDTHSMSKGIGISNIISRAKAFQGEARFISEPQKGCALTVRFPGQTGTLPIEYS